MSSGRWHITGTLLAAAGLTASSRATDPPKVVRIGAEKAATFPVKLAWPVEVSALPEAYREKVVKVAQAPTLSAVSKSEEFDADPKLYAWMLEHPDRVSLAWRRLGIAAVDIKPTKDGNFSWADGQGSELAWSCVSASEEGRIWYAEGKARAGALLPLMPVKAVAVLRHKGVRDERGKILVRHQVEIFLQTDSRAGALLTRLLGGTAPKLAEQGADQVLLYFAAMGEHLAKHPERAAELLAEKK